MKSLNRYLPALALCLAFSAFSQVFPEAVHRHPAPHVPIISSDVPAEHGMQILGTDRIYTYHIADHAPHDFQVILEVDLDNDARRLYLDDQKAHPQYTTYTIAPEFAILPDLLDRQESFTARLYRGNYTNGKGGVLIADRIHARIRSIVYLKRFDPAEPRPADTRYIVWGDGEEQFAAHYLTTHPDFDQVVQVKLIDGKIDEKRGHGIFMQNSTANIPAAVTGNTLGIKTFDANAIPGRMTLLKQLYFEPDYIHKYYDLSK